MEDSFFNDSIFIYKKWRTISCSDFSLPVTFFYVFRNTPQYCQ